MGLRPITGALYFDHKHSPLRLFKVGEFYD